MWYLTQSPWSLRPSRQQTYAPLRKGAFDGPVGTNSLSILIILTVLLNIIRFVVKIKTMHECTTSSANP